MARSATFIHGRQCRLRLASPHNAYLAHETSEMAAARGTAAKQDRGGSIAPPGGNALTLTLNSWAGESEEAEEQMKMA